MEPRTPSEAANNTPSKQQGESWTSNTSKHGDEDRNSDDDSRKRLRVADFDLVFDVVCYRRHIDARRLILFPKYRHGNHAQNLPPLKKFDGTGDPMIHLFSFVYTLHPLGIPKSEFPMLFDKS